MKKMFFYICSALLITSCECNNNNKALLDMYQNTIKLGTIYQINNDVHVNGSLNGSFILGTGHISGKLSEDDYYCGLYESINGELCNFTIPVKYCTFVNDETYVIEIVDIHEYINMWHVAPAFENYKFDIMHNLIRNATNKSYYNCHHTTCSDYGSRLKVRIHIPFNKIEQYIKINF